MGIEGTVWVKNFSVGICDGVPSTAHSSFFLSRKCHLLFTSDAYIQVHFILDFIIKPTGGIQTPVGTTNNIIR